MPPPSDETATEALAPLVNIIICMIILNTIFLILRFFTVLYLRPKKLGLGWDDWLLLPAYLLTIGVSINILVIASLESGNTPSNYPVSMDLASPKIQKIGKAVFSLQEIMTPAYGFTRLSVLCLYLRVFTGRVMRGLSWFMVAIIIGQVIAFSIATGFQCIPIDFFWDKTISGHCFDILKFYKSFTPCNIAADVIILFQPFVTIWNMDLPKLRKAGISALLGMGVLALAASIVRAVVLDQNNALLPIPATHSTVLRWPVIESALFFITSCLPAMHPLFRLLVPSSMRQRMGNKVTNHRHSVNPRLRTGPGMSGAGKNGNRLSFTRLVDDGMFSRAGGMTSRADGRKMSTSDLEQDNSVPLQHIKQVAQGHGIMVTQEVTVTQEERIENVFGL